MKFIAKRGDMKEFKFWPLLLVFLDRYAGWSCLRMFYLIRPILNCILYLTGSQ